MQLFEMVICIPYYAGDTEFDFEFDTQYNKGRNKIKLNRT
jgi:hypothetical protein